MQWSPCLNFERIHPRKQAPSIVVLGNNIFYYLGAYKMGNEAAKVEAPATDARSSVTPAAPKLVEEVN